MILPFFSPLDGATAQRCSLTWRASFASLFGAWAACENLFVESQFLWTMAWSWTAAQGWHSDLSQAIQGPTKTKDPEK